MLATLVAAAAFGASAGSGALAQATVIDRTLLCTTVPSGGVREIGVRVNTGFREGGTTKILAFAAVSTGEVRSIFTPLEDSLAWVSSGRYDHNTNLSASDGNLLLNATRLGTWGLNRTDCTAAQPKVPLSGKGLRAAVPDALGVSFDCTAPRRVLVRVRMVAHAAPARYREDGYEKTKAPLQQGFIAVRTQAGKQLAFASVFDSGQARLAVAPSCTEE